MKYKWINQLKSKIKKNLSTIIVVLLLLIIQLAQFLYFKTENKRLADDLYITRRGLNKDIEGTREAVKRISGYFEEKGNITIDALIQSYLEFRNAVDVYDRNVEIYNDQIEKLRQSVLEIADLLDKDAEDINQLFDNYKKLQGQIGELSYKTDEFIRLLKSYLNSAYR